MNTTRSCVSAALAALDDAVLYILENVRPGTPGKVQIVMDLRQRAENVVFDFAHAPQKDRT